MLLVYNLQKIQSKIITGNMQLQKEFKENITFQRKI